MTMPDRSRIETAAITAERVASLGLAAWLVWTILPAPVKQAVRTQLARIPAEVVRWRRVRHERRMLESEAWHVGAIVRDYERMSYDSATFARALGVAGVGPDGGGRPPGVGET